MKKNTVVILAALLAGSTAANATPVSWLFSGTLTVAGGSQLPSGIQVGDPFSAILNFDTSTQADNSPSNQSTCFPNNGGPGSICHFDSAPVTSQYWSNLTINGVDYGEFPPLDPLGSFSNQITVRNNAPDPLSPADTIDGYAFTTDKCSGQCGPGDTDQYVFAAIRGLDLNLVTDALLLPTSPSPSINTLRTRDWEVCSGVLDSTGSTNDCEFVDVEGTFNSVTAVPLPASLPLLGVGFAGLLGLASTRRRQRN